MKKIVLTFGSIAGAVCIGVIMLTLALDLGYGPVSQVLGYLVMIVALSVIFVGVKRYRDQELGGVIRFGTGFLLGLGITAVAGVIYVAVWEVNLLITDYAFINEYTAALIEAKKAEGLHGPELEALVAEMDGMKEMYDNPLFRLPMTFLEIFPVGLLMSLIAAAVLRNTKVLPAGGAA